MVFPARAELVSFKEAGGVLRATVRIDGNAYDLDLALLRPARPAPGAPLFVETAPGDDLAPLALSRGFAVLRLDLTKLPGAARTGALRDLAPRLRGLGAKRLVANGQGETGAALAEAGALFDGVLLQDAPPTARRAAGSPRIIETWGADAYWGAGGERPPLGAEPENRRSFFLTGVAPTRAGANCAAPVNGLSPAPALRALLAALDDWTKGAKPPGSRAPAESDLVQAAALAWPKIPGLSAPPGPSRRAPKIDADGNELSGLRLPDQALPIATFTGFNARKDPKGPACAAGAALPFPATKAEREKTGDPRASLVERYGSRAYFVATMRVVADKLVRERLLLKEDADAYVAAAKQAPF
ncbi:alpha/beta hydrolase domain-containing protein [Methylocystis echinoides]|uniref:alpha/beta hydrolase domain-containing protein n=1 Tax=Methylocystis echinoides TaxID=29468 RepID=UPI003422D139